MKIKRTVLADHFLCGVITKAVCILDNNVNALSSEMGPQWRSTFIYLLLFESSNPLLHLMPKKNSEVVISLNRYLLIVYCSRQKVTTLANCLSLWWWPFSLLSRSFANSFGTILSEECLLIFLLFFLFFFFFYFFISYFFGEIV